MTIILHHGTLTDFVSTRFDKRGPFVLVSATKDGVTARRPYCAPVFFAWSEWWGMPAHHENSLQAIINPNADGGKS